MNKIEKKPEIFIGITTWNSELLLPLCLDSIQRTAPQAEVVIIDNCSTDTTHQIAQKFNARLIVKTCSQPEALSQLAKLSRSSYTVLIHADVVFLSCDWIDLCKSKIKDNVMLVSPEDIGCGPYTRPWGKGQPESSFMFFKTECFQYLQVKRWYRQFRIPYYRNQIDFYGNHVTYNIPKRLESSQLTWFPMSVHTSDYAEIPYYVPPFQPKHWSDKFGYLRYGLGNFYSIDNQITHYHNWYDRIDKNVEMSSYKTAEKNNNGVPVAYLFSSTQRFINDYKNGILTLPKL